MACTMRNEIHSIEHKRLRERIRQGRIDAGLKQSDIAKKTNRSQAYISKFENGDLRLDVVDFMRFCDVIGCNPFEVLFDVFINTADKPTVPDERVFKAEFDTKEFTNGLIEARALQPAKKSPCSKKSS